MLSQVCGVRFTDYNRCVRAVLKRTSLLVFSKILWEIFIGLSFNILIFGSGLHRLAVRNPRRSLLLASLFRLIPRRVDVIFWNTSRMSWITMGFVYGGVAPLLWPVIALAMASHAGQWRFMSSMERVFGERILKNADVLAQVPHKLVGVGLVVQVVGLLAFFLSNHMIYLRE